MNGVLEACDVAVAFGRTPVLHGVHARFGRGWTAIVGPNGAGKSTLLRVLAGLLAPQRGSVRLDGRPLAALRGPQRGRHIAWLAQRGETTGELTVRETVALGRLPHRGLWRPATPGDDAAVARALAATECTPWQHRRLGELSGGERQRALLARALATEARVLLLDEPTTHLDPPHQVALARLARRLAGTHAVVTVMHDLPLALAADRVLLLDGGRVRADTDAGDPALHAAIRACFGGAVRIAWHEGRASVMPEL